MTNFPALWRPLFRKEAFEMLHTLWNSLDDSGRARLGDTILAGPPEEFLEEIDEKHRISSRDRMIFERITVLEQSGSFPLTDSLRVELSRLQNTYPAWHLDSDERSRFVAWKEVLWGSETEYSVSDLNSMDDSRIIQLLVQNNKMREGLLESWAKFASANSIRAMGILENMAIQHPNEYSDIWNYGLQGMTDTANEKHARRLLELLLGIPEALFKEVNVYRSTARAIKLYSDVAKNSNMAETYWKLFERTLVYAKNDTSNLIQDHDRNWIFRSINSSIGDLFLGFIPFLFARKLKEGSLIPEDMVDRLNSLINPDSIHHRPARVLAASKLSYLYSIDPEWTRRMLLPAFNWSNERESIAVWQGFGSTASIDPKLWAEIKYDFLNLFSYERLTLLDDYKGNFICLLMRIGIEASPEEYSIEQLCSAANTMFKHDNGTILEAADWISMFLYSVSRQIRDNAKENASGNSGVDFFWQKRVLPWMKQIWPADSDIIGNGVSEHLAEAAILADDVFPEVFDFVQRYLRPGNMFSILDNLAASKHPEKHPMETIRLLELIFDRHQAQFNKEKLHNIIDRVTKYNRKLSDDATVRKILEALQTV